MPCLRNSARSKLALRADCSPFILTPRLSVPAHTKVCSWLAAGAAVAVFLATVLVADMAQLSPSSGGLARIKAAW
jgi:hypothetical protein